LSRDLLLALAEQNPSTRSDLDRLLSEVPWRRERFGDQVFKVLSKQK
jgi:hypothetical protein